MKAHKIFFLCVSAAGWMLLTCLGCRSVFAPAPAPAPILIPTATPTVNLTPVCGMTPVSIPAPYAMAWPASGVTVIRDLATWNSYFTYVNGTNPHLPIYLPPAATPTPVPPPPLPVNFSNQMVVLENLMETCNNIGETVTITNVCVGPTQVTVNVADSVCTTCPFCNNDSATQVITSAVAVPQSSLPVTVVYTTTTY